MPFSPDGSREQLLGISLFNSLIGDEGKPPQKTSKNTGNFTRKVVVPYFSKYPPPLFFGRGTHGERAKRGRVCRGRVTGGGQTEEPPQGVLPPP